MKTIHYILIVSAILLIARAFILYNKLKKNISFDFNVGSNAADILGLLQSRYIPGESERAGIYFDIPLTTIVKNNSASKVVLENIMGSVSYDGQPILQTKANSAVLQNIELAKGTQKSITDNVQLLVNESTINFFKELIKGNKPKILYNFSSTIFGKPKNFTNQTTINKT